jgi:hypothetical protein
LVRKFFPYDKNYLLEQAQQEQKERLLAYLLDCVRVRYLLRHNPLNLDEEISNRIKAYQPENLDRLGEFYDHLSAVYRFRHGSNQLEFLFDGSDHFDRYMGDWAATFKNWVREFCEKENFLRAVLDLTVLYPQDRTAQLAEQRMRYFFNTYFELKVYRYRGIQVWKRA